MRGRTTMALTALCSALTLVAAPTASAVPDDLTEIDASGYTLADNGSFDELAPWVSSLDTKLDGATFSEVLADANRDGSDLCRDTGVSGATGFCWKAGDDDTTEWFPQGISGSWDADPSGEYEGHRAVLVSWYHDTKGVRVSLVDYSDPAAPKYRHILLVEPTSGDNFKQVKVHAGGIAWYGPYLHVVDTSAGIRVFDLRHLWHTAPDSTESKIGKGTDGKYYAYNYAYALPQVGKYSQSGSGKCDPAPVDDLDAPLCFSWVSLDRGTNPPSLVTGEFFYGQVGGGRLARWNLDSSGLLAGGTAAAAYQSPHISMQGGMSSGGEFLMTSSRGSGTRGYVYHATVGEPSTSIRVPPGIEDLSYEPSTGRAWTLTEYPNNRAVFSIPDALG